MHKQEHIAMIATILEQHPYSISSALAAALLAVILFSSSSIRFEPDQENTTSLQIVDIKQIQKQKRISPKEVSREEGEVSATEQVERTQGTSKSDTPVDIDFQPSIAPPKPIGALPKIHPKSAKDRDIEATLQVSLVINKNGLVTNFKVLHIRLSKKLPPELKKKISQDFIKAAGKMLRKTRFTSTVVNGKKIPIKTRFPLRFALES